MNIRSTSSSGNSDVIRYTSCAFHCLNACILKVRVRNGMIVAIEPDDTINGGVPRDYERLPDDVLDKGMVQARPCVKGYAWKEMIYDPNRLLHPMKRVGKRGEGKFQRISWDEAIETIAQKLVEVKNKYGPYSIMGDGGFSGSRFVLAPWFGAGVALWGSASSAGWEEPVDWVLGKTSSNPKALTQDQMNIFKSKLIVLWGFNPLTTWNGSGANEFLRAKKKGIPIVCIDPRYTQTIELLADQWIPIRPGTDVAMIAAMTNVWFKEGLWDREYVEECVEPDGFKQWQAYVLGSADGVDKTPEWAEGICGIPAETIVDFARLYARSKPVNLLAGLTIGRQFYGENNTRALMYLQAVSGNTSVPGGTAAAQTGIPMGKWLGPPVPAPDWQRKPGSYTPPALCNWTKWLKAINLREKLDKGEIGAEQYNNAIGNVASNPCPNFQMVIIEDCNSVASRPNINSSIQAMKKVEFSVVWAKDTDVLPARYADMVLPMIYHAFEGRSKVMGTWDLWALGAHIPNHLVYRQKCIETLGEARPSEWLWTQVAKKLGIAEQYNPRMVNVPYEQWDDAVEAVFRESYEKWAKLEQVAFLNPPAWDEFQKKPVFRWELKRETPYHPFKEDLDKRENPFKGTLSGKIEFHNKELAKGPEYLATHEIHTGGGRCYGPGNLPPIAQMVKGGRDAFFSAETRKYPLLMSSPHAYYRIHAYLDNNPMLRDCYRHAVWMSVADARVRNLKDNDLARVYNDVGEMIIPVYVTSRVVPGNVVIHHGAWFMPTGQKSALMPEGIDGRGAPNLLTHTDDVPDTIIGWLNCKGLVEIEKWKGC